MKFDPKKTIFLIDGSSFLYRAYYGMRPLHTSKGMPIQAVYSFCRMIKKLTDRFNPSYIALVWDSKGKTERHEIFEDYKATRDAPPSDLFQQKEKIVEFADLIGLAQLARPGIEADDLMYSIVKEQLPESNYFVLVTSDKDMGQLLSDKVVMFDAFKDHIVDEDFFEKKMGFPVRKLPFYFALLGDSSDNIPGVRGIGKKGATELVQKFDSLEDMYSRLDDVEKARMRNALTANKDNAFLSHKLFLLRYTPTGLKKQDLVFDITEWPQARPLFEELEFKSLLADLEGAKEKREVSLQEKIEFLKKRDFRLVITEPELDALCAYLKEKKNFAIDTETNGVNPLRADLVGVSVCAEENIAYYIPCGHKTNEEHLSLEVVKEKLKPILEDATLKKSLHNSKFDRLVFHNHGIDLQGIDFDTLIAANLVIKDWQRPALKKLSVYYFDEHMLTFADVVKTYKYKDFSYVPLDLALLYSANDAHQTYRLTVIFKKELKEQGMQKLYESMEFPLIDVLYEMEKEGIYCDVEMLKYLNEQVTNELELIQEQILGFVEEDQRAINLNSPQQMQILLFEKLKLPPQKKSAKGGYSTNREVLKELAKMHPVPGLVLKYRELFKIKSTYIDALPAYVNKKDHRIHTTFSQTATATGRLASFDPNLQNIPASGVGIEIRAAFKPKEGNLFISADYSQIELRVLAYLSQDKNLMKAFDQGLDIHRETASRLFDVNLDEVTHAQRQIGKRINFSILYGLTPFGLSKDLGIPYKDAKKYIEKYFEQYPGVSKWMDKIVKECKDKGYVKTYFGRRRYVPGIYERNKTLYEEARRIAINTVAQGTAAGIMKLGMINLSKAFQKNGVSADILLQIHDELLISVAQDQDEKTQILVKDILESVVDWDVPLVVDTRSGRDWKKVSK